MSTRFEKRIQLEGEARPYTVRQVADLFGVTTTTVSRWRENGKIPPEAFIRTPGGQFRYDPGIIDKMRSDLSSSK